MAVLAEAISVIIHAGALSSAFPNFEAFKRIVPNQTFCADGELVRVGFMAPDDARAFVEQLEPVGLRYVVDGKAKAMIVVDQLSGPLAQADWVDFGHVDWRGDPNRRVACCRLRGSSLQQVVVPDQWTYENSLFSSYLFVPEDSLHTLRRTSSDAKLHAFRTPLSDKEFFIGRTGDED